MTSELTNLSGNLDNLAKEYDEAKLTKSKVDELKTQLREQEEERLQLKSKKFKLMSKSKH